MQTRIERQARRFRYHFDSLGEMGEYINRTPGKWRKRSSRDNRASLNWDLSAGYDKSVDMARFGWLEGAEKAQEALKAFMPATPAPDTRTGMYGYRPHVPRFCAGAPDSMIQHTTRPSMGCGKVLTLIVPVNANVYVSAKAMANFGTAVAQYINQLETDGTRVELVAAVVSEVSNCRVAHTITVKGADQPLDLAVVAFAIGHPAMFRRLGFALRERCDAPEDPAYGMSQLAKVDDMINAPPGAVVLNGMRNADTYAPTPQAALAYVSEQIEAALAEL